MATICTNNLTGNDTTGDGSPSLPYKTINKALSVSANGDLVKVAGGQFVQVTGTVTVTARATTMTTSVDMTGSISLYDVIAIDTSSVDGWDREYTLFTVLTINATTITVTSQNIMIQPGTYNIYRMNAYHYSTTSTTVQETITTFTASTVTVSGGWSSDFNTQIGWTTARYAQLSSGGRMIQHNNVIKPNVVWDKFLFGNTAFSDNTSNGSFGIRTFSFVNTSNTFGTSNYGIYNPTGETTTLINNSSIFGTSWNGGGNRPDTLLLNQYITSNLGNTAGPVKAGFTLALGNSTGPSIRTSNLYVRTQGSNTGMNALGIIPFSNLGDVFIDNLYVYVYQNVVLPIYTQYTYTTAWRHIGNINVFTDTTNAGISPIGQLSSSVNMSAAAPFNMNRTSGTLDSLPWRLVNSSEEVNFFEKGMCPVIYGKDTEGQKVLNQDGILRYADTSTFVTGYNSLRQKLLANPTGDVTINKYMLGTITKPTGSTFTINIVMKASKTLTTTNTSFSLLYGPARTSFFTLANTPTVDTTWRTYSYLVNTASYPNWNLGDDGLMTIFYNYPASSVARTDNDYIWVDSITIS